MGIETIKTARWSVEGVSKVWAYAYYVDAALSKDSINVYFSMDHLRRQFRNGDPGDVKLYWDMYLQRSNGNPPATRVWNTVGSRSGYISADSPSHRTFTNVGQPGSLMRVMVKFRQGGSTHYMEFIR